MNRERFVLALADDFAGMTPYKDALNADYEKFDEDVYLVLSQRVRDAFSRCFKYEEDTLQGVAEAFGLLQPTEVKVRRNKARVYENIEGSQVITYVKRRLNQWMRKLDTHEQIITRCNYFKSKSLHKHSSNFFNFLQTNSQGLDEKSFGVICDVFSHWPGLSVYESRVDNIITVLEPSLLNLSNWTGEVLSESILGVSSVPQLSEAFLDMLIEKIPNVEVWNVRSLNTLIFAMSKFQHPPENLLKAVLEIIPQIEKWDEKKAGFIEYALKNMDTIPSDLIECFQEVISPRKLESLRDWKGENFRKNSLMRKIDIAHEDEKDTFFADLLFLMQKNEGDIDEKIMRKIFNYVQQNLEAIDDIDEVQSKLQGVLHVCTRRLPCLSNWSAKDISRILSSLRFFTVIPQTFLELFAEKIKDSGEWYPKSIRIALYGLEGLIHTPDTLFKEFEEMISKADVQLNMVEIGNALYGISHRVSPAAYSLKQELCSYIDGAKCKNFIHVQALVQGLVLSDLDVPEDISQIFEDLKLEEGVFASPHERNAMNVFQEAGMNVRHGVFYKGFELDFFFPGEMLNIELDGSHHEKLLQRKKDAKRDRFLESEGIQVLRVPIKEGWYSFLKNVVNAYQELNQGAVLGEGK